MLLACLKLAKYLKIEIQLVSGMLVANSEFENIVSWYYICASGSWNGAFLEFLYRKAWYGHGLASKQLERILLKRYLAKAC